MANNWPLVRPVLGPVHVRPHLCPRGTLQGEMESLLGREGLRMLLTQTSISMFALGSANVRGGSSPPSFLLPCRKEGAGRSECGCADLCQGLSCSLGLELSHLWAPPLSRDRLFHPWRGSFLTGGTMWPRVTSGGSPWPGGGTVMLPWLWSNSWLCLEAVEVGATAEKGQEEPPNPSRVRVF